MNPKTSQGAKEAQSFYRATNCLLCGSADLELALPLAPSAIGNDYFPSREQPQECYSLSLFLCHACGNVQVEDVVNPNILFRSYTYSTSSSLGLVEHFRKYAEDMIGRVRPAKGTLAIDIGSNDGSLLRAFKEQGMRVLGVDPAVDIAKKATAAGMETVPDFFTSRVARELKATRNLQAAIITANNVFAHSDKLPDMADGIRELLAPDGVFSFEVSYLVDTVQKMLFDTVYHEHLCYHSVRSLASFFKRHGMELIQVDRIPTKGGSIRGTAQRAGGPRPVSPVIADLIQLESTLGLDKVATYRAYAERIDAVKNQLQVLLSKLKAQGKTIAGYGASPTVTTLLYHFDLADKLDFLVDDNPVKQNTYSPGQKIPVYDSQKLYDKKADYAVILAWNYAGPIMKRHQAFADRGGRFIVPLPLLQVA
jgi:hypothetical protein